VTKNIRKYNRVKNKEHKRKRGKEEEQEGILLYSALSVLNDWGKVLLEK
jgi:hypothetical protein